MSYYLILGSIVVGVVFLLWKTLSDPLRSVPGPFEARWTDWWYLRKVLKGDYERTNRSLHHEYGPIVRYGPGRYSIDDLSATELLYGKHMAKSSWYTSWGPPAPLFEASPGPGAIPIFADQSIERHAINRKLFQSTYSMSNLVNYESYVDDCADIFARRLQEASSAGLEINMRQWFQCYAFDVIGMITYGKRFGFLNQMQDVGGVIAALDNHLSYATLVGIFPSLHPFLFRIINFVAGGKGSGRQHLVDFTKARIGEHMANPKAVAQADPDDEAEGAESFLSKFFVKHLSQPNDFTRAHVMAGCMSNIIAGADTTAISLSATLYYLLEHKDCLKKALHEISQAGKAGQLSEKPTFKETQEMPYLQAVIKEALRIHPLGGLPLERVVPEGGVTIRGQYFPKGTTVGVNMYLEHFNTEAFGDDASMFKPERWLIDDTERLKLMNRHWIPFGLGSRTCIGRHIATLEMSKLLPKLLRDFDIELAHDAEHADRWQTLNRWFVKPKELKVRVQLRTKSG